MKTTNVLLLACGLALAIVPAVSAQTPEGPPRVFVTAGGGYQAASHDVAMSGTFTLYDEQGTYNGTMQVGKGGFFDVGGGVHIMGNLSAGVLFSRYSKSSTVPFTVVVPHPLYFNQPRTATMNANDLAHTETSWHFQLLYQLFSSPSFDASVVGGPSVITVKEDSIKDVTATETGAPYTTVTLAATFQSASKTTVGYNVGFNVNYHVTAGIAAGFFVRYTGGTADLPWASVKAGGAQFGGAVRYGF